VVKIGILKGILVYLDGVCTMEDFVLTLESVRTETTTSRGYKSSCVFIEVVLLCSRFLKCGTFIEVRRRKVKIYIKEK
jgi:hypothetical protein